MDALIAPVQEQRQASLSPPTFPFPWAVDWGQDRYGLWQSFSCRGVWQQLRWIPPGRFLMGSPADEPERYDDERQHEVVLTEGFWLADTACTQGLWQAVTDDYPSRFQRDDNLPVETVSWEDCLTFIEKINGMIPGVNLRLPTEAQWEYACRAGTVTPFSFGTQITTGQVNYDGNYPYRGGKKGEYRRKTVAVKSLPCNNWGLYAMHGNVWEWCADWLGDYEAGPVPDPRGPATGVDRVLRGGGWIDDGHSARSARRDGDRPGARGVNFGLRLSRGQQK
ncbi:MAG: formylglycine-generating enzyme family protein [Desulfobulbaceae bacterium]|nr:formylglycine-generating enzyme family protein [Desulfobulbaceae bacterium]